MLANPPYSIKQWNRAAWSSDPYGRNIYGVPPQGRADYAFFQHIIASLKPDSGCCAMLFPHGVLFRAEEQHMRAALYSTMWSSASWGWGQTCSTTRRWRRAWWSAACASPERQGRILFVNAVNDVTRERAQSFLEEAHIQKILRAYQDFRDVEHFARVVPLEEIHANQENLNIAYYVRPMSGGNGNGNGSTPTDAAPSLAEVIAEWEQSSRALRASMDDLFTTLDGRDVTNETKR